MHIESNKEIEPFSFSYKFVYGTSGEPIEYTLSDPWYNNNINSIGEGILSQSYYNPTAYRRLTPEVFEECIRELTRNI